VRVEEAREKGERKKEKEILINPIPKRGWGGGL
jgi:hypothetical protein